MSKKITDGRLIVLEGIDGTGKTTQCGRLAQALKKDGWNVVTLREPTDGPFGKRIRELAAAGRDKITPEEEMELFLRDRRENVTKNILPAMRRGSIVLMDRYYYSSIAYQGALGLNPETIRARNEEFAPPADLLLYLEMPAALARRRIEGGRKESCNLFEREEYLEKVGAIFGAMADPQLVHIDAAKDADDVFAQIHGAACDFLEKEELEDILEEINELLHGFYFDARTLTGNKAEAMIPFWEFKKDTAGKPPAMRLIIHRIDGADISTLPRNGLLRYEAMRHDPDAGITTIETDGAMLLLRVKGFEVDLED